MAFELPPVQSGATGNPDVPQVPGLAMVRQPHAQVAMALLPGNLPGLAPAAPRGLHAQVDGRVELVAVALHRNVEQATRNRHELVRERVLLVPLPLGAEFEGDGLAVDLEVVATLAAGTAEGIPD